MSDDKSIPQMTKGSEPMFVTPSAWLNINVPGKGRRMKPLPKYLLLTPFLVVLGGCQTIYEGKYDWDAGWRPGTVLEVGSADQVTKEPFRDCRPTLSSTELNTSKFAVVRYSHLSRPRKAVVPVLLESTWSPNDPVYINIRSCKTALEPRASGVDRIN